LADGKYLVLDNRSVDIITSTVAFSPRLNLPAKAIMLYDFGPLWLLPHYRQYLQDIAQRPAEWGAMYDFLFENRDAMVYVTSPERATFMSRYLQVVHHKAYRFEPLEGTYALHQWHQYGQPLQYYSLVAHHE
jgi:hypothetical protein